VCLSPFIQKLCDLCPLMHLPYLSTKHLHSNRILTKFFERFILQKKSEYIDDDGNVIKVPGEQYDADGVRALY